MTFLELCQETRKECGIQGSNQPVTVVGQSGILKRVVGWVKDADLYIQRMYTDWDFLWSEFNDNTISGSDSVSAPIDLGEWDRESFALNRGLDTGRPLSVISYVDWRDNNSEKTNQEPTGLTVLPNGNLALTNPADGIYSIYATYWKSPVELTNNTDTPAFNSRYHRAIICKAKMFFFEDTEAIQLYQLAEKEFNEIIERMEKKYLPDQYSTGLTSNQNLVVRPM